MGIYAVQALRPAELGVYGLLFAGFVLAGMLHGEGVFTPAEVALLGHPPAAQLAGLTTSLRTGFVPAIVASVATMAVTTLIAPKDRPGVLVLIAAGATTAAVVSPFQDHVRRVLHQSGHSAVAASVAVVQLLGVLALLGLLHVSPLPTAAVPFAALTLANVASLTFALWGAHRRAAPNAPDALRDALRLRRLAPVGRWLLYGNGADRLAVLCAVGLVTRTAGATTGGHLEAVRVLAQPVVVAAVGAHVALRSRSVAAARARDLVDARRWRRVHAAVVLGGAAVYALVALPAWPGNPLRRIYAPAFAVGGLGATMVVGTALLMVTLPWSSELVATGRERAAGHAIAAASLVLAVVALLAVVLDAGAFAVPLALGIAGLARLLFARPSIRRLYGSKRDDARRTDPAGAAGPAVEGDVASSSAVG